jgi:hypothetical protein
MKFISQFWRVKFQTARCKLWRGPHGGWRSTYRRKDHILRQETREAGAPQSLLRVPLIDLRTYHQVLPLKISTTSRYHHHGKQASNTRTFLGVWELTCCVPFYWTWGVACASSLQQCKLKETRGEALSFPTWKCLLPSLCLYCPVQGVALVGFTF